MRVAPKLHGLALNRAICADYADIAQRLQDRLEGSAREAPPNWFALAWRASQEVGRGMAWSEAVARGEAGPAVRLAWPDPRVLAISLGRVALMVGACGLDAPRAAALALLTMLEEGSREIHDTLACPGRRYLEFVAAHPGASWRDVLQELAVHAEPAESAFRSGEIGTARPPDVAAAALALYHEACGDPERRDGLIEKANRLLLLVEQREILPHHYFPSQAEDGVQRADLMRLLTPFVQMGTSWSYADFAASLPDRDGCLLTPPVSERNWANFGDRWPAIEDYARRAYDQPALIWNV